MAKPNPQTITPKAKATLELAVNEDNKVMIFHNRPFIKKISWLEFDLSTSILNFVFEDGTMQDLGHPVPESMTKNMHNAHQVLVIEVEDDTTAEPVQGVYYPIILHKPE